ncbi:hypothetical protein D9M71_646480 [compost metagenome]
MAQVAVDQPRITHHATAHIIGHQAAGQALEQRHAQHLLHLAQGLGGPGLGDGHGLGCLVQGATAVQFDKQA